MWAPFFEFPWEQATAQPSAVQSSGSAVLSAAASQLPEKARSAERDQAPQPITGGRQSAASNSSPQSRTPGKARKAELKPGAVVVGTRADGLQVRGLRIRGGVGRCLASLAVIQDRAYWEVHVLEVGSVASARLLVGTCVGTAGGDILLQDLGATPQSYGVKFQGSPDASDAGSAQASLQAGDVISVAYDQAVFPVSILVWHNGVQLKVPAPRGLKGEQWPALFIADCTVDWALDEAHWECRTCCPVGYDALMPSRGLL
mmetsp:Transcript_32030/g.73139  ORF Transcript_32030/g.73139 Transcript_32030/m.73139 type:complete len:259 (+) Transcript_32030:62-838(+)